MYGHYSDNKISFSYNSKVGNLQSCVLLDTKWSSFEAHSGVIYVFLDCMGSGKFKWTNITIQRLRNQHLGLLVMRGNCVRASRILKG